MENGKTETFEKLGLFYLGRNFDFDAGAVSPELLLYDAKDLTTHAVCVGMTGSGKTGLCIALLEEAAIDGIPALAIDPKGDLGNLLLNFPDLRPADFRPWIDEAEAQRKGMTPDDFAQATADGWRQGLADWGQDGARLKRLREAADVAIYTPGSSAGLPLAVLRSFAAPPAELLADAEALGDRISSAVSGLLALVGVDADPMQSREHILLSNLFKEAWQNGRDLDLPALIAQVQSPPLTRIGVMDLESFFPAKERFGLSMRLNNLLAAPGFAAWMEGEPLEIPKLLWTGEGRPRIAILSIAHLSDAERMFFVTLLLNEVVAWMRGQSGTSSLRALLYMDEVFGFFPPTANPPAKTPMLTLLKQARAFGLGVVLATQNPADLDYKGLSNAGTWFLGRLQTERDKMRVLEGLAGASQAAGGAFDAQRLDRVLAGLQNRVFLMNNVHEDAPVIFQTRWAMSYLRGPLTRDQIETLMAPRKAAAASAPSQASANASTATAGPLLSRAALPAAPPLAGSSRPVLPSEIPETFLPATLPRPSGARLLYRPALIAEADFHFVDAKAGIDRWEKAAYIRHLESPPEGDVWQAAVILEAGMPALSKDPEAEAEFAPLPPAAARAASYRAWQTAFKYHVYRDRVLVLRRCPALKLSASVGEEEAVFRLRVREAAREQRDQAVEKLRQRFAPKLASLQNQIQTQEERIAREASQYEQQKLQTAISVGATVLGALFGRKTLSAGTVGRATTSARGVGRASREKEDVAMARERLELLRAKLADLEAEFADACAKLAGAQDPAGAAIEEVQVHPRKADISAGTFSLVWTPWFADADGRVFAAFK